MPRFQYISDIHLEDSDINNVNLILTPSAEYLILAGDIGKITTPCLYEFMQSCSIAFEKTFVVLGNHDYYGFTFESVDAWWTRLCLRLPNIIFLNNKIVPVDNILVCGTTFWSCPDKRAKYKLPLFRNTGFGRERLTCDDYAWLHVECKLFIHNASNYARNEGKSLLVITHYPPLFSVLRPIYLLNGVPFQPKSSYYASNCAEDLKRWCVDTWVFGHTAYNGKWETESSIGKTKLVANQFENNNKSVQFSPFETIYVE